MLGTRLAHFRITAKLGEGGMGAVYRAEDTRLGREVAIKVLPEAVASDPERLARFEQEARTLAVLDHPNIVTLHAIEQASGVTFLIMSLVEGETLDRQIPATGLPVERLFDLAIPIAEALGAAHGRGITHRDLKPANVMVTQGGEVKILDFGLAKGGPGASVDEDLPTLVLTREGLVMGTAAYMSPEQAKGASVDARSDVFSLGTLLYEMATGARPFRGETSAELVSSILRDDPPPIGTLRADLPLLGRVVGRCLEKNPEQRYRTARDVALELHGLRRDLAAPHPGRAAVVPDDRPSVAVLPFSDMSPERDQDYFCEGIADEIINALAKVRGLRVTPRRTAFKLKDCDDDAPTLGRRLGVDTVLEGGVRKASNRLRITVQLVDVARDTHLWSEKFDRDLADVFAVQEEIAKRVVDSLKVTLTATESRALARSATTDLHAYECYLKGRSYLDRWGRRNILRACEMFKEAIEVDPEYALAYAGLADSLAVLYTSFGQERAHLERALAAGAKAIELQPDLAEGHSARGFALSHADRHEEAEREFAKAVELDPMLFEAHYFHARASFVQGKLEAAARSYEEAARMRPEDYQAPALLHSVYVGLGRPDEALRTQERALRIIEKHLEHEPDDVRALYFGAGALVTLGASERGLAWLARVLELDPNDSDTMYNAACVYSLAGAVEEAIDCLEKTLRLGAPKSLDWVRHDSDLDALRDHPRFRAFVSQLR